MDKATFAASDFFRPTDGTQICILISEPPNIPTTPSQNPANSSSFRQSQFRWKTDPTFYPTARLAMESPAERYAYVAALAPDNKSRSDALLVVDIDASSGSYGKIVGQLDLPNIGDELHHFGWNACSTALCPYAPHPHLERRYLVVPGIRSSRIHIVDTKPDPTKQAGGCQHCFQSPEFPIRSSQIIRHSRSDSPRSITCSGVEPSKAGFGLSSQGPICEAGTTSARDSKSRNISETFL